ncbi:MAG: HAMP domain-containing histidine kinase [Lachnospiraceae bacterium]|nr:HAMP domain-containing histidine kinase [Lachnospiraceae bacterium]
MSHETILFFLILFIALLLGVILYQHFVFRVGTQARLREIGEKLKEINDTGSDEKVFAFTDNSELMELMAQINRLLEKHLKTKADYRRSEMASKKMLSNISHDIKTPMTVILGYLEILRMNGGNSDEMLEKTERKAKDVMELINQFFTLAKLESGDMALEATRIDLCEVCRESILDFYELLTKEDFEVDIALPETPVYVQGDQDAVGRILSNLISNVIRYGAEGKYIGLSLRTDEKSVFLAVADKGKGIDKAFAESVFERLFTMEDSRNRNIQGNGLGLAIARNLAIQLGGNLTLDSIPYEKTTFTLILPKERNL